MVITNLNPISPTWTHLALNSGRFGYKIRVKNNCTLKIITKHSDSTATRALLYTSAGVLIASSSFSGNNAAFNNSLNKNTEYIIETDNNGSDRNLKYRVGDTSTFYPVDAIDIVYIGAVDTESVVTSRAFEITNVTTEHADSYSSGSKYLKTAWPLEDGLTAGTTSQTGHKEWLEEQGL